LQSFGETDADLFFGREVLVAKLIERIVKHVAPIEVASPQETHSRILAIVGASGSGKSSILKAGVLPMLRWNPVSADWLIYTFTPTAHPLHALAGMLTHESPSIITTASLVDDLLRDPRALYFYAQRLLQENQASYESSIAGKEHSTIRTKEQPLVFLAVDQFEELFTLCRSESERQAFITALMTAVLEPDGRVCVVLTLRADFYAQCAPYAALREALASQQEYIGPMTAADLRRAIEEPARRGNWELEPGLVDVLLKDLGADGLHLAEPGALPLLSHALLETWTRRRGRTLTISGYLASGGVRGAIAETAEAVFQDELDPRQQGIARNIFLRLTELGDEEVRVETRRRATFKELIPSPKDADAVRVVLTRLADARLIVTDQEVAEVAHEALIREWPTLREWLEEGRDGLRLHRHLTLAAESWLRQGRDPGDLYRGARLAQAVDWAQNHPGDLNAQEREFLEASQSSVESEKVEREAQRQRELEAAHALAETQSQAAVHLRRRALYLIAALVLALGMAAAALFFGIRAYENAQQAQTATRLANTRELAAAAINSLEVDPERGILLALQAISITRTTDGSALPEAEDALHRALLASHLRLVLSGHEYGVLTAAFSPDGHRLAAIGIDGTVKVWDSISGAELLSMPGSTEPSDALGTQRLAYSPDGKRLVTGDSDLVKIWDAATGAEIAAYNGHAGEVWAVAYSPDGSRIASAGVDATARIWDAATGKSLFTLMGHEAAIESLAFSPNGERLASAGDDNKLKIWDTDSGRLLFELENPTGPFFSVAYSPDGRYLTSNAENGIKIWEADTGLEVLTIPVGAGNIVFSPDGQSLAAQAGSVAKVWDVHTGRELLTLAGHTDWIIMVAFSPDGKRLATASLDHTARVWDIGADKEVLTLTGDGHLTAFSPDGITLATDDAVQGVPLLWDSQTGEQLTAFTGIGGGIHSLTFSPDGKRLVTGSNDFTARIWDVEKKQAVLTLSGHSLDVRDAAFSLDGKLVATAGFDGMAKVWDATTGAEMLTLEGHNGLVTGVAFSPDGSKLATSSTETSAKIWALPGGELLLTLTGHTAALPDVAFSPDGSRVVTASRDATAKVWDATSGSELFTLTGHRADIWSAKFSPDGNIIATASGDNTAKIWDSSTGKELLTLPGSQGGVTDVAFSPRDGGADLAVASTDGTVRVFLLRLSDLLALAHQRVTRGLTTAECQQYLHTPSCPGD
jgi:WD40 repeat protein